MSATGGGTTPPLRVVAQGLRFPEGPVALPGGELLVVEIERQTLTRIDRAGARHTVARPGGGPNGAALGPEGLCYVCNNGGFEWLEDDQGLRPVLQARDWSGGRIERVDLRTGALEVLYTAGADMHTGEPVPLRGPNDLVMDGAGGFWFTDLGKARRHDMDRGRVFWARTDGSECREVIWPLVTPNGIGLSPDGETLYVAETEPCRLWAFRITGPGEVRRDPFPSPHGGRFLYGCDRFRRFDSLAVDEAGHICVATLIEGGITVVPPDGGQAQFVPMPDRYTTNLCFGGEERRTVFATLSASGRVVAFEWPRPGLALHFNGR